MEMETVPFWRLPPRPSTVGLAVKDALRSARFLLRRGRDLVEAQAPREPLPGLPTRDVIAGVDRFAKEFDGVARRVRELVFDLRKEAGGSAPILEQLLRSGQAERRFAELSQSGLDAILQRFGAQYELISEVRAAEAFVEARAQERSASGELAANLFERMRGGRVLIDFVSRRDGDVAGSGVENIENIALFALLLWMLSEPPLDMGGAEGALGDCADIAIAIRTELTAASDREALAALFETYRDKV